MNVQLVIERGKTRKVFPLKPPQAVLGRAKGNTIRIPSAEVSRRHCRLIMQDGLVSLEDLDSINGTQLNGQRIKQAEIVRPGDRVTVGPISFIVEYELTPDALERLQEPDAPVDMLEALADGEVMELNEVESVESPDLDVLPLSPDAIDLVEDLEEITPVKPSKSSKSSPPAKPAVSKPARAQPKPPPPSQDEELIPGDFQFDSGNWDVPATGDLRDILSQIEDEETAVPSPPPPKKKKK